MACTRKLAQGIEHRQDFHLVFISHLDQDFKVRACACPSVFCLCLCFLIRCPAHKPHVSTRHFARLLSYCDVQRNGTLTFSVASRILQSVPGLADPSSEICDPLGVACKCALTSCLHFAAARLSSSGANPTLPHRHRRPATPQTPSCLLSDFQHSPARGMAKQRSRWISRRRRVRLQVC
jgi:hypothetical protein